MSCNLVMGQKWNMMMILQIILNEIYRYLRKYPNCLNAYTELSTQSVVNWFRCCPPRVGQLVKTTVTTAVIG